MTDLSLVLLGPCLVVRYMRYKGGYPAKDYLEARPEVMAKLLAIARGLSTLGRIEVSERGHMLTGKYKEIMELKPGSHRILGFRDGTDFYLTNGAPKKKKQQQESDYKLALEMQSDFHARKNKKR